MNSIPNSGNCEKTGSVFVKISVNEIFKFKIACKKQ